MIDPDLKNQLDEINKNLVAIQKNAKPGIWRAFFNGIFGALGYMVGVVIVILILGWILQKTGLLPAFQEQIKSFTDLIDQAKKLTAPANNSGNIPSGQNSGGGQSTITLPNGLQYRVNVQQ